MIDNHTCTQDFDTGNGYDSELGMDFFTGQGMGLGLTFDTESVEITLGSGKDSLAITSWVGGGNMTVDLGAGDDRLAIGNPDPGFGGLDQFNLSGLNLIGGDGTDRLEFNDAQSYPSKGVSINGRAIYGLMPGVQFVSLMPDFEAMTLYLGEGCTALTLSNPAVPTTAYSQGATIRITALGAGGQIRLFGGARPDKLIIGATSGTVYVHGSIVYTAGSATAMDTEDQYQVNELGASGSLLVNGGPANDWLRYRTARRIARPRGLPRRRGRGHDHHRHSERYRHGPLQPLPRSDLGERHGLPGFVGPDRSSVIWYCSRESIRESDELSEYRDVHRCHII